MRGATHGANVHDEGLKLLLALFEQLDQVRSSLDAT
jgi:hypothetical protein